jgi:hypothetical protein
MHLSYDRGKHRDLAMLDRGAWLRAAVAIVFLLGAFWLECLRLGH